ncbi:glutamyl-tRNA synthetase [Galdieria sulphuraria]|uniref:glutamate--tRNA ligase n=1 Tax=Galdieria sulphuraria TaxID=130081 RepID=M2X356_GALSU|nr:glutamyl-tRNA synthetase [Galdieria sulphuraria]EME30810.1 glutamyl-tRNA synthetase [Galdieria sulphuraria]|eukprot:XP_005707330.1 glutamyl-tRNA synthetase [Galdieria sulphuraria]
MQVVLSDVMQSPCSLGLRVTVEWIKLQETNALSLITADKNQSSTDVKEQEKRDLDTALDLAKRFCFQLLGTDGEDGKKVQLWLQKLLSLTLVDQEFLSILNQHLLFRSFLVGYRVTLADVMVFSVLHYQHSLETLENSKYRFLSRWASYIRQLPPVTSALKNVADFDFQGWSDVMRLVGSRANFEFLELPNAEYGKVITRFPPEPSGYLHIGHVKAALLNDFFARRFHGTLILRFDDTNPSKENMEFESSFIEDLRLIGVHADIVEYTSDYFQQLELFAETLIEEGKAYVDMTPTSQMREERLECKESAYRNNDKETNMKLWNEMKLGSEQGIKCCLRAKIDMKSKNGALRDPILYRCLASVSHHRMGTKYKVYPTYDFACPIVDSLSGVTHALRTNEYQDREAQYYWMLEACKLRKPILWVFSRLSFMYTVMSKRKLQWFVSNNYVSGWDDPRFPTIRGIRRRGMTIEALRAFILSQGGSKNTVLMEWDKIWTVNKRVIDPIAPRHTAINRMAYRIIQITNAVDEVRTVPFHKKNPDLGNKIVLLSRCVIIEEEDAKEISVSEIVTLMDWGNIQVTKINGKEIFAEFLPQNTDFKKTKKLTWLAFVRDLVPICLVKFDHLITKAKVEEDDRMEDIIRHNSKIEEFAWGDINLRLLRKGDVIQFERRGYYICDNISLSSRDVSVEDSYLTLIEIPDGRGR